MRHPILSSKEENLVFGYQDSLKEQFSDRNEFLKYPKLKQAKDRLKEFMSIEFKDGQPRDQVMRELLEANFSGEKWDTDHFTN